MKKTLKLRALLVFIAILFLLPTLAACGGNDAPPAPIDTGDPDTKPQTKPAVTNITLSADDVKGYNILMPKSCETVIRNAATDLLEDMRDAGFQLKNCTYDGGDGEENIPADAPEILIGLTNRPQSTQAAVGLRKDDYRISVSDSRIIIVGGSPEATVAAIASFFESYVKDCDSIKISKEYLHVGEYNEEDLMEITVNGNPICEYTISTPYSTPVAFDHAVSLLTSTIAEKTAYLLPVKQADAAQGKAIRIEISEDLNECEYSYSLQNDVWTIKATSRTILFAVRNLISAICVTTSGMFDLTDPGLDTFLMNTEPAPMPSDLAGKLPVALCDQQNSMAVIIDLAANDPTANSAVLWQWKPSSSNGFTGTKFGSRIDEFKLRYSPILKTYVVCSTSSAGFMGLADYPTGRKIWEAEAAGYGPHSIDYLPSGNIAVALSGNGTKGKQEVRLYACDEKGVPTQKYVKDELVSAHGILWDNDWGVLWALGNTELIAYEIGGTPQEPTLTRIPGMGCKVPSSGHDLSVSAINRDKLYLSSNSVYVFNKYTNTLDANFDGSELIKSGAVKSIAVHTDGSVLRAVAANVFAAHDTNILDVFRKNESGEWEKVSYTFQNRAFYKARPFILY